MLKVSGKVKFESFKQVARNMDKLAEKIERQAMRESITKASRPIVREAKNRLKPYKDTGLLAKSIKRRVRTYKSSKMVLIAIGPDRNVVGSAESESGQTRTRRPVRYAHLVEFGTRRTRARPFMRPSFDTKKGESELIYRREMKPAIQRIARRVNKKIKL